MKLENLTRDRNLQNLVVVNRPDGKVLSDPWNIELTLRVLHNLRPRAKIAFWQKSQYLILSNLIAYLALSKIISC